MTPRTVLLFSLPLCLSTVAHAELKLYDVDARYRREVAQALDDILPDQGPPEQTARVALLPTGQILVDAPDELQGEIAAVLDAIARQAPGATPSVSLRYWVLFGVPGTLDERAMPAMLEGVVRELEAAHGDLGFTVLEAAALSSVAGSQAVLQSERAEIAQTVYPNGATLNLQVTIQTEYQELDVKAALRPGEFLVLGESTVENEAGTTGTMAFVVHWPESE